MNLYRAQLSVFAVVALHVVALGLVLATHLGDPAAVVLPAAAPHVVLAVLLTVRALKLRSAKAAKARVILTIVLAVQLLSAVTGLTGHGVAGVFIAAASMVFEAAALAFLWVPARRPSVALGR